MLKDNFFRILKTCGRGSNSFEVEIEMIADHRIYQGHFPGKPITPGVCEIEIVKEVVSDILEKNLMLSEAKNIKFTNIIDPNQISLLNLHIELDSTAEGAKVKAELFHEDTVYLVFRGFFVFL